MTTTGAPLRCLLRNGANALADITADGNVFGVRARVGSSDVTRMLVDEDGEIHAVISPVNAFDEHDDAMRSRQFDLISGGNVIETKFDEFVEKDRTWFEDNGIIGKVSKEDQENGAQPLYNLTRLQKLHNGAIGQQRLAWIALANAIERTNPGFRHVLADELDALKLPGSMMNGVGTDISLASDDYDQQLTGTEG